MSSSGFVAGLDPAEAALSVEQRLAFRGRTPDQAFAADEQLYLRVNETQLDGDGECHPNPAALGYPGSDGMSVNRGKYSLPGDVLWPNWSNWSVARATVGSVTAVPLKSGDGRAFHLEVQHDPQQGPPEPENFAHTLIVTVLSATNATVNKPSGAVKKLARQALASLFFVMHPEELS